MTGRDALLQAFDRLFTAATTKLDVTVSPQERTDARERFAERFGGLLELAGRVESPPFPADLVEEMEAQIARISPTELAGVLASIPLAHQAQEMLRTAAVQHAQQRMLEHFAAQAESRYGGN